VTRVFAKAAIPSGPKPAFVTGDFNGDGAEDLAVLVKANDQQLSVLNDEMANWVLEDPKKVFLPRPNITLPPTKAPEPVRAEKGEPLLAIIHGVGPGGWRNADAKQTFVLKNSGTSIMTEPGKGLREGRDRQKLPPIRGDAIREAMGSKSGLIIWNGAKYGWYSPEQ
jgi:hypothetical protein